MKNLTVEETKELEENLEERKRLSDEIARLTRLVQPLEIKRRELHKRYYEILDNAKSR